MFKFRKIAAVLAGAVMLSSTVALAAAASYPVPFVQNGKADVGIVYGSSAANTDLVAALEINTDLSTKLAAQTATGATSSQVTVSGGDYVALDTPSTKLHVGGGIADVFGRSVTKTDMPTILADGTFRDANSNDHDYTQKINMANLSLTQFSDSDYLSNTPTVGFDIGSGQNIMNYTLAFTDNPQWGTLKGKDITIMGKDYYILDENNGTGTNELDLLDAANTVTLNDGDSQQVTVGNNTYNVSISFISGTGDNGNGQVTLNVNGQTTDTLTTGDTYKLPDGSYLGIKSILSQDYQGGQKQVEFSIGEGKIVLTDGNNVKVDDSSINSLTSSIVNDTANQHLSKIVLQWNADNTVFIANNGSSVTLPTFSAVKLSFGGMNYPMMENITVKNDGDNALQLSAPIKDGTATFDILNDNRSTGNFTGYTSVGKDSSHILRTATGNVLNYAQTNSGDYFVASWNNNRDSESYVLDTTSWGTDNANNNVTTIEDKYSSFSQQVKAGDSITLGNVVLTVSNVNRQAKTVTLTGNSGVDFSTLYTNSGLKIYLPFIDTTNASTVPGALWASRIASTNNTAAAQYSSFNLVSKEADKDGNVAAGENFTLGITSVGTTTFQISVNSVSGGAGESQQEIQNSNVYQTTLNSALATQIWQDQGPTQHSAMITYHGGESYGELVLSAPSATVSGSSSTGGSVTALGSVTVADSEVSQVGSNNLIVIGGSCINTVAAQLLGSTSPLCGDAFTAASGGIVSGQALIKTFQSPWASDKIATLVAGYDAGDTTNAAKYLTTQNVDTTVGVGVEVTSATQAVALMQNASG